MPQKTQQASVIGPDLQSALAPLIGKKSEGPVWKGPCDPEGGVTHSILSRFLVCRERAYAYLWHGLTPEPSFNPRIEFGNMWHVCEEALANNVPWKDKLLEFGKKLAKSYPTQVEQMDNWYNICKEMFPLYVQFWKNNREASEREAVLSETVFCVPIQLPFSKRTVYLKGKFDSGDRVTTRVGKSKSRGFWLQENKTKSDIDITDIQRQLSFDCQTMIYLTALTRHNELCEPVLFDNKCPLRGVRYNVVKRPRQYRGKKETPADFYKRLSGIVADSPQEFFARWDVAVTPIDIITFCTKFLLPSLENMCNWWSYLTMCHENGSDRFSSSVHWMHPYGIYNVLNEGGIGDLDSYIHTGNSIGLSKITTVFPELECG